MKDSPFLKTPWKGGLEAPANLMHSIRHSTLLHNKNSTISYYYSVQKNLFLNNLLVVMLYPKQHISKCKEIKIFSIDII